VAAGSRAGGWSTVKSAQKAMTGLKSKVFKPNPSAHAVYKEIYALYRQLHDAFGTDDWSGGCHNVMKQLLEIRARVRK
jgi:L-ribulokinase